MKDDLLIYFETKIELLTKAVEVLAEENKRLRRLDENVKEWISELKKSKGVIFGSRKYLQKILESLYE